MPRRKRETPPEPLPAPPPEPLVPCWDWERQAWSGGHERVAGVDEAGRGPLAGPVVAAAVILPRHSEFEGLQDSKVVPLEVRERLYLEITTCALAWAACAVEPEEIDRINILRATHQAMAGALARLEVAPHHALVDGLPVKGLPCEHTAIIDGDAKCVSIAAASIIAKVTRDRLMVELDRVHPGYGFAQHKGYSTPDHYEALRRLGPSPCHRRSFRPIAAYYVSQGALPLSLEGAGG
jgi:ribonuclease HII